jgi:plasmid stabilization system protein ParE
MKLPVILSSRAEYQLENAFQWWRANRSEEQAVRWFNSFAVALDRLGVNPERWPFAPENSLVIHQLRQFHFGLGKKPSHRAIYTIRPDMVFVLSIRHVAQGPLEADDL